MENSVKVLAMSLSAILKNYDTSNVRLYISDTLEKIKKFNRETKIEYDEEWDKIETQVIIDDKLEKIIKEEEVIIKNFISKENSSIEKKEKLNKDLIKTIENILNEVLEKEIDNSKNNF